MRGVGDVVLPARAPISRFGGPVAIVCATSLMAFQDAFVKALSSDLPLWQFFFVRSAMVLPVLALFVGAAGSERLRAALSGWFLARSALIVAMYVFFYAALPVLDLALVSAIYYTGPLFIVVFAGLFLREPITAGQGAAVVVAFAGVMLVLRPAGDDFSFAAVIPLASAICYALAMVTTRGRMEGADPWALALSLNIVFVVAGGLGVVATALIDRPEAYPFLLASWTPLSLWSTAALAFLAAISIGIHVLLARAYQLGPTAVVAGLDFSYLGFAGMWAFVFFGAIPDLTTVLGAGMIGVAGLWGVLQARRARGGKGPPA